MTAAVVPGFNHQTFATLVAPTIETALFTADTNGSQLLWLSIHNADASAVNVKVSYYAKSTNTSTPFYQKDIPMASSEIITIPGLGLREEDEIRVTVGTASVISITGIVFENVSGDRD